MKHMHHACAALLLFSAISFADVQSDILELTGNLRAQLAWVRFPWADTAYNPIQEYRCEDEGNEGPFTQLWVFDTDEGTERCLDDEIGYHIRPRFTRKTGEYVVWTDQGNSCAWIRDFAGASPKRKLLNGGEFNVVHCRYDSLLNKEFFYTLSIDRLTVTMIPFNDDYTADLDGKETVYTANDMLKYCMSFSADGKYMGNLQPWPNTMIIEVENNTIYNRHVSDPFGCQPNIAPDNSYRFFYLRSSHDTLRMWEDSLDEENWDVPVFDMPGNFEFIQGHTHDCVYPRWSNHTRFFTNSYPLVMWHYAGDGFFNKGAQELKDAQQFDSCGTGVFCLGRFTEDYSAVDKYVRITTCDVRKRDVAGDAWIAPGVLNAAPAEITRQPAAIPRIVMRDGFVSFDAADQHARVEMLDARGKIVAQANGTGRIALSTDNCAAGVHIVRILSGNTAMSGEIIISR